MGFRPVLHIDLHVWILLRGERAKASADSGQEKEENETTFIFVLDRI